MPYTYKQKTLCFDRTMGTFGSTMETVGNAVAGKDALLSAPALHGKEFLNAFQTISRYKDTLEGKNAQPAVTEEQLKQAWDYLDANADAEFALANDPARNGIEGILEYRTMMESVKGVRFLISSEEEQLAQNPPDYSAAPINTVPSDVTAGQIVLAVGRANDIYAGDVSREITNLSLLDQNVREFPEATTFLSHARALQNYYDLKSGNRPNVVITEEEALHGFDYVRRNGAAFLADVREEMDGLSPASEKYQSLARLESICSTYNAAVGEVSTNALTDALNKDSEKLATTYAAQKTKDLDSANQALPLPEFDGSIDDSYSVDEDDNEPAPVRNEDTDYALCNQLQSFASPVSYNKGPFDSAMSSFETQYAALKEKTGGIIPGALTEDTTLKEIDEEIVRQKAAATNADWNVTNASSSFRLSLQDSLRRQGYANDMHLSMQLMELTERAKDKADLRRLIAAEQMATDAEMREHFLDPSKKLTKLQYGQQTDALVDSLEGYRVTVQRNKEALETENKKLEALKDYGQMRLLEDKMAIYANAHPAEYAAYKGSKLAAADPVSEAKTKERLASIAAKLGATRRILGDSDEYKDVVNGLRDGVEKEEMLRRAERYVTEKTKSGAPSTDVGKARLALVRQIRDVLKQEAEFGKKKEAPAQAAPEQNAPAQAAPEQNAPAQNAPEQPARTEVDELIAHLEEKRGAPVSAQFRANLQTLHDRAAQSREALHGERERFMGGNELRTAVTYEGLKRSILTDKFNDNAVEVFSQPDSVDKTITLTHLSSDINYLADREHPRAVYEQKVLSQEGMDHLIGQCRAVMEQTMKDRSNIATALLVTEQIAKQKQQAQPQVGRHDVL